MLTTDKEKLKQILINLISNASDSIVDHDREEFAKRTWETCSHTDSRPSSRAMDLACIAVL